MVNLVKDYYKNFLDLIPIIKFDINILKLS